MIDVQLPPQSLTMALLSQSGTGTAYGTSSGTSRAVTTTHCTTHMESVLSATLADLHIRNEVGGCIQSMLLDIETRHDPCFNIVYCRFCFQYEHFTLRCDVSLSFVTQNGNLNHL